VSAGDLGAAALRAALFLSLWGTGAAIYAAWRRDARALVSARIAAGLGFGLIVIAALSMMFALAAHDFSILYVAENNARETPTLYSIISLWAALEGSILLWTAILAGATAFIAFRGTLVIPHLATTALAVMFAMLTFFLLLITTPAADPFARLAVAPENGNGPNALLQNHPLMALHPPLLYLGYVLTSVPFAYAIASLILGEGGDRWLVATRRFALISYLHSVMVEEKRSLLRVWNLALVVATFALTILGTFLTRSGVVNSVHSFSLSAIGPILLGYLVAILVLSVGLLLWRSARLRDAGPIGAPLSREAIFLFQNVLFMAATLTVLLGTLYPLVAEAISGAQLSIGGPYFDRVEIPVALALLFLMGVGPQLPWHGASRATLERQFTAPIVAAAAGAVGAILTGTTAFAAVLTYALGAFVFATVVQEFARGIRARRTLHGEGGLAAFSSLLRRSGRRYGGYIVHVGIVLIALAVATSQARTVDAERTLAPGESLEIAGYTVRLEALRAMREPQRDSVVADLAITGNGTSARLRPALVQYPNSTAAVGSPGIGAGLRDDLYTILAAYDQRTFSWATIRTRVIPGVSWLWLGGAVVGIGALIAALPGPRRHAMRMLVTEVAVSAK
jgi:cytochrome c-type biogenesis protein CcmF